ncbi:hypothetical protein D9M68_877560 [compost metagenome]|uniref:hypothetical protein n=1 Tax=Cupriavidus necator TaxID=106590 RepID=UPI003F7400C4
MLELPLHSVRFGMQRSHVDSSQCQLAGVPDQPSFDASCVGFQMELQAQHLGADRERLMRTDVGASEPDRACRNVELIAMPISTVASTYRTA